MGGVKTFTTVSRANDDYISMFSSSTTQKSTNTVSKYIWVNAVAHQYLDSTCQPLTFTESSSNLLILGIWIFSEAAFKRFVEGNRLFNDLCERCKRKLERSFLPSSFSVCTLAKSSSSLLISLRVINSETSKLLRRVSLGGFVVVNSKGWHVSVIYVLAWLPAHIL